MEKMTEAHCQQLLHDIVSLTILDLVACFIFFIIMRWIENVIENRFLFLRALLLQFLLSYLLDKLCPKYITLSLSYIYISTCKSILSKSILKIYFSLVTRNRGKVFFIIMRWIQNVIENRFLFLPFAISYICISMSKSILPKSILKIDFSLVTRNRGKVFFIIMRWIQNIIENRFLFLPFAISYICISMSKSILPKSILKIDFSLVTINRWKITFLPLCLILLHFYVMISDKFYPKQLHYLYYLLISHSDTQYNIEEAVNKTELTPEVDTKDVTINRDELAFVMERIGEATTKEGEKTDDFCMGFGEFSALFQESEPGLDEVKEAFSVFDQNRDGLVNAQDLQRVLINLGLREGTNLEACQRMIAQHDRNKDGNVDLIDFSRLLEMSLLGNAD